ncbi:MAG: 4-hydroxythreonine-4-phosphate dehydrogenase PdxA [Elusimicrobia bacterium]|nr:4-hydroxythreonine-4-phosphate dehydrogenase PdxA [Elusimicrobiota bacterium]
MTKPVIAITIGDPSGIGPEIVKKAVSDKSVLKVCKPLIIGTSYGFVPGKQSLKSSKSAILFLKEAVTLLKRGRADALVTGPVSKSSFDSVDGLAPHLPIHRDGTGHTEFLAKIFNTKNVEMLMVAGDTKVHLLTRHIPLSNVGSNISVKKIINSIKSVHTFIRSRFGVKTPKAAICGLNPHCGDGGLVGSEEQKIIIPAVRILKKIGVNITGPLNPEVAFTKKFDLIICTYHDQAMLPLKLLKPNVIVNLTIGLPFIRTSPGHGTAYDIAGRGIADYQAMIEAIKLAAVLTPKNP